MYVLGLNGNLGRTESHDPAAFLLRDGRIVYGSEEERHTRVKYSPGVLPTLSIRACLKAAGIRARDLDGVAFPQSTWGDEFTDRLRNFFQLEFGHVPPITFFDHHTSHAASTYFGSGVERALVLTMDGSGDGVSSAAFIAEDGELRQRWAIRAPNSLGFFYSLATQFLGFVKNGDEYKVMALASYGSPRFDLSDVLHDTSEGYEVDQSFLHPHFRRGYPRPFTKQEPIFSPRLVELLGEPRVPGEPLLDRHRDVAASVQARLEQVVVRLVASEIRATGAQDLCLAGGVALNGVMNTAVAGLAGVRSVYVPPVPHDAGCALGAAMLLSRRCGVRVEPVTHAFHGDAFDDNEIRARLRSTGVRSADHGDGIVDVVVDELARGRVIGWFQGAMEIGPRALGARSLLADPRVATMKDRINRTIKEREDFQPLAPSALSSDVARYFSVRGPSPFMSFVVDVRPEARPLIPAVVHVDHTARVQTVTPGSHLRYERLLEAWRERTGIGVLLNTSLNRRGEPIVRTPNDALADLFGTAMDGMALGTCYVTKR